MDGRYENHLGGVFHLKGVLTLNHGRATTRVCPYRMAHTNSKIEYPTHQ